MGLLSYKDEVRVWVELGGDVIRHNSCFGIVVCNVE